MIQLKNVYVQKEVCVLGFAFIRACTYSSNQQCAGHEQACICNASLVLRKPKTHPSSDTKSDIQDHRLDA